MAKGIKRSTLGPSEDVHSPSIQSPAPRKRTKLDQVDSHAQSPPSSASPSTYSIQSSKSDMEEYPTYLTANGNAVTPCNAGALLSRYTQSFGLDPTLFKANPTFTMVPDPSAPERKHPTKPQAPNQPPPDVLFQCTMSIPPPCPIPSCSSPGIGLRSKDIAKRFAAWEYVKALLQQQEFDDDLNPTPKAGKKDRPKRPINGDMTNDERKAKQVAILSGRTTSDLQTEPRGHNQEYDDLRQTISDQLPSRTPAGADGMPGIAEYDRISSPAFWDTCPPLSPSSLHPTVFTLLFEEPHQEHSGKCRPVLFLTSRPLPIFEDGSTVDIDVTMMDIGTEKARSGARMRLTKGVKMKTWENGKLEEAMIYSEKLVRAQLNKAVRADLASTKWVLVPLVEEFGHPPGDGKVSTKESRGIKINRRSIAWDEISAAQGPICAPFTGHDPDTLGREVVDSLSCAKAEFSRRYYLQSLLTDLSPSSPHPKFPERSILDLATQHSPKDDTSQQLAIEFPDQPIILADQVHPAKSGGYVASVVLPHLTWNYLIPELVQRHIISASVFRTTSVLPHVLSHIDDLIIAQDLSRDRFSSILTSNLALNALTCPSSQAQAPTQSYQRLELLGDCLLKLVSTIDMYLRHLRSPSAISMDNLHVERHLMVSNRSLQANAVEAGIVPYIRSSVLRVKDWMPLGWTYDPPPGAANAKTAKEQRLGDKTVADVAEALIGAAYLSNRSHAIDSAIKAMRALHIPLREVTKWSDANKFARTIPPRRRSNIYESSKSLSLGKAEGWMRAFQPTSITLLGYEFTDPQKANDVLVGLVNPIKAKVQRLSSEDANRRTKIGMYKVLGDALLDYLMIDSLYVRYPDAGPAALSHMRHSRSGDNTLAALTVPLNLIEHLADVPPDVAPLVQKFHTSILEAQAAAHAAGSQAKTPEEKRECEREWWNDVVPLTFLGDVTEAVIGAILVDSHFDVERCRQIFEEHIEPFFERYCQGPEDRSTHPKSIFLEMMSERGCAQWECKKLQPDSGPIHSTIGAPTNPDSRISSKHNS